jgi:Heterokaryon incompatibility protein (HET)
MQPLLPEEYKYETLNNQRRSIRLLNLFSSSSENPQIECELVVKDLNENNKIGTEYEALSWRWGTAHRTSYINIRKDGRLYRKQVPPDLIVALKALRHPHQDRYLWVDAVCINQDNYPEKNRQVEMMSIIYGEAKSVCIWLGEGDKSSCMAFKFIRDEVLQLQNFDDLCDSEQASSKWSALLDLMQRPWFSRRWVVQEIALAQDAMLYCGADSIPWKDFAVAVELFVEVETATHRLSEVMKKDPKFYNVPGWFEYVSALGASLLVEATGKLFRDYKVKDPPNQLLPVRMRASTTSNSRNPRLALPNNINSRQDHTVSDNSRRGLPTRQPLLSLEYLVSSLSVFEVTVEHDTIYALLAIAKDTTPCAVDEETGLVLGQTQTALERFTQRKRYKVAYEEPYVDVCKDFVQFCISQSDPTRALDIICRPWAPEDKKVGRRYRDLEPAAPDSMRLPSWIPQLSGAPYAMYPHGGIRALKMGRKNADMLVGLPSSLQRNYNAAETKGIDRKTLRFRKRVKSGSHRHYSMYVKGFVLDTIAEVFPASQGGAIPQEWIDAVEWPDAPYSDPPDVFWRTLVADRGRDGRNPPVYYSRACQESFLKGGLSSGCVSTSDLINNQRCSVIAQFCRRVQAVIWNRSLIKTKSGRLGLASKNVQRGDSICVLYGCSVPVVLRKSKIKTDDEVREERQEDFENLFSEIKARWVRRHKHMKLLHILRIFRENVLGKKDKFHDFRVMLKWGRRWKKKVRLLAEERRQGPSTESTQSEDEQTHPPSAQPNHTTPVKAPPINPELPQTEPTYKCQDQDQDEDQTIPPPPTDPIPQIWQTKFQTWLTSPPDPASYYYHSFLGECYIHGMMDGEAMAYQNNEGIRAEAFEFR